MRMWLIVGVALLSSGCLDQVFETERQASSPAGLASTGDIDDLAQPAQSAPADSNAPAGNAEPAAASPEPQSPAPPTPASIPESHATVVDVKQAMAENPNLVIVEDKIKATDPLTVAASAYVTLSAKASTLGFQQALQAHKAINGRPATYDEFMQMMQQNRVEFAKMRPYRFYGYDAESGGIVILEDKQLKRQLYEEKGIPWDE